MAPSTFVAMTGLPPWPPVAYGLATPERAAAGLSNFGVTGKHVTLVNAFVADPGWDRVGLLRILLATRGSIPAGEEFVFERRLVVTPGPDVASVTDLVFPMLDFADGSSGIAGRVEPVDVRAVVAVETADGSPVTQVASRTDGEDAGRYRVVLPSGDYVLVVRAAGRALRRVPVKVAAGSIREVPVQRFDPLGVLVFDPAFRDLAPGRVVVQGIDGTPDPVFGAELLDFTLDGEPVGSGTETRELHFVDGKPVRVAIAPGRYRLTATRGLEFDIVQGEVDVPEAGAEVGVPAFEIERRIEARRARTRLSRLEQTVVREVRAAVRNLGSAIRGIQSAERRRVAQQETLRAEEERLRLGDSTPHDVLEFDHDLADAERQEIFALRAYRNNIAALERAQGTSLRTLGISVEQELLR